MASILYSAGLDISPAVGDSVGAEFNAYIEMIENMPDLTGILDGKGPKAFPQEPSIRYAVTVGLASRSQDATQAMNSLLWMIEKAPAEWVQLFAVDILARAQDDVDPHIHPARTPAKGRVESPSNAARAHRLGRHSRLHGWGTLDSFRQQITKPRREAAAPRLAAMAPARCCSSLVPPHDRTYQRSQGK